MEIHKLPVHMITDDKLLMFYRDNYNFTTVTHESKRYVNIPIISGASLYIEKEQLSFPWDVYVNGFVDQYRNGLPKLYVDNIDEREAMIYRYTTATPYLPTISYKYGKDPYKDRERYFDSRKVREYGKYMACCFLTWEVVITGANNEIIESDLPADQVFSEELLTALHSNFNDGTIWEEISIVDFIQTFQSNGRKIKTPVQGDLCFLLSLIEKHRNKVICTNYEKWVKETFGISNYKTLKNQSPNSEKRKGIRLKFNTLSIFQE